VPAKIQTKHVPNISLDQAVQIFDSGTLYSTVGGYQCFRRPSCLHVPGQCVISMRSLRVTPTLSAFRVYEASSKLSLNIRPYLCCVISHCGKLTSHLVIHVIATLSNRFRFIFLPKSSTLKREAAGSSIMPVPVCLTTQRHILEDCNLGTHCHVKLLSTKYILKLFIPVSY
jgi:hypothetical protein